MSKKKKQQESVTLCEGIILSNSLYDRQENRIRTLLLKAVIVYLLSMGSVGAILTAVNMSCYGAALHIILLLTAALMAGIYYNRLTENVGGILILLVLIFLGVLLRNYINSGFYAVLNELNDHAADYFELSGVRVFAERIHNRKIAVTVCMAYIGTIGNVLFSILLMRKMRYMPAACMTLPLLLFPIYIQCEPNLFYVILVLAGLFGAFVFRRSGHDEKTNSNASFSIVRKKKILNRMFRRQNATDDRINVRYQYHSETIGELLLLVFLLVLIMTVVLGIMVPKEDFMARQKETKWKKATNETVQNLVLLGISGLFNRYDTAGGMRSGRLGGVNAVNLDYNTDLVMQVTPYTYDRIYLKYFTGGKYVPYENIWKRAEPEQCDVKEAEALQGAYVNGNSTSAQGTMVIRNVAALLGPYVPYYSMDTGRESVYGSPVMYTYYPRLGTNRTAVTQEVDWNYWLEIPEENDQVIADICEEGQFGGSTRAIVAQIKNYYQENIPYTLRPGMTPRKEDFINYFLTGNRKGYCAHFASAATLIFRYLGIPARYVEGYAVDYSQILEGSLVPEMQYEDYYDGYSELGKTALVEVELTDANAHAWVEIYDETEGWKVVEVTPYSTEGPLRAGFWSMFLNWLQDAEETDHSEEQVIADSPKFSLKSVQKVVVEAVVLAVIIVATWLLVRKIRKSIRYVKASENDKLIMDYAEFIRRKSRRDKALNEKLNYREQIQYLTDKGSVQAENSEKIIQILEQAGFSKQEIGREEQKLVQKALRTYSDKKK